MEIDGLPFLKWVDFPWQTVKYQMVNIYIYIFGQTVTAHYHGNR